MSCKTTSWCVVIFLKNPEKENNKNNTGGSDDIKIKSQIESWGDNIHHADEKQSLVI